MARIDTRFLGAFAGPRVRPPSGRRRRPRPTSLAEHFLSEPDRTGREAVARLLVELDGEWRDLQPWPLQRPDPLQRIGVVVPVAFFAPIALLVFGSAWPTMLAASGLSLGAALWWRRRSPGRVDRLSTELARRIQAGASLAQLEETLEDLLEVDPAHDGARLLLALHDLQTDRALSALLQLAPLRDRHPDSGEVVVLAALAYAQMEDYQNALRMLSAVDADPRHPWAARLRRFTRVCQRQVRSHTRVGSSIEPALEP